MKGHFARECRSPKDSRRTGAIEPQRRIVPSECESWPPSSLYDRPTTPIIEDWVSDSEDESEKKATQFFPSFVQSSKQVKSPRHSVQPIETTIPATTPKLESPKPASSGKRRNRKACFVCKSVDHLTKELLTQSKSVSITTVRPVSAVVPKFRVTQPRHAKPSVTKSKSPIRRHLTRNHSPKTSYSPPELLLLRLQWLVLHRGNPQYALKDKRVVDSGCSLHMTWNMSYLSDFEELNGGYVAFGGNLKDGKISDKGKIKTGKLDFEDVYFVKELKFNLFSVSQMCDKKNSVLFTDTECLVWSPDFELPDESQVLLRVPRENNMYNNRVLVTKPHNKTPYELLHGRPPSIGFMRPFGCPVTILNTLDSLGKFKRKVDEGFLVGYSVNSSGPTWLFDIDSLTRTMNYQPVNVGNQTNPSAGYRDLSAEFEDFSDNSINKVNAIELEDITYFDDEDDVGAEADFNNLETSITVTPIPTTRVHKDHPVSQISGDLSLTTQTRSMTRVVEDQGGLSQMFNDDFYTCMFTCFLSQEEPKRDPRAWYETLANFLLENGFQRGKIDQTLFIKRQKGDILLVQIYVDDIIFGATNKDLCKYFEKLMKDKFQMSSMGELTFFLGLQMSSMGELTFFLGLQVKQNKDGIFISQDKYVAEILRKFGLTEGKSASTPIDTEKPLLKDPDGEDVDVHTYRSMIGSLMYLTSLRPDIMFVVCACTHF
nr:hypothetical protein [Tanacetum cinerariifolium]